MKGKKLSEIDDLDNLESVVQNNIAQTANLGVFAMGVNTITDFTQINPSPIKADNKGIIDNEHTADFHGKIIVK